MTNQVEQAITSIKAEREALKARLEALGEALSVLAPWEPRANEKIAPRANVSVREASSAGPVTRHKEHRFRKVCQYTPCSKGFLGRRNARFHRKKCFDSWYTINYRKTGQRIGKATHPPQYKSPSYAKPISELGHYRVVNGKRRLYTYHTTPEQRREIARKAGMAAANAFKARKLAARKAAQKGVTLIPGDPITAQKEQI